MIDSSVSSSAIKELKKLEKVLSIQLRKDATDAGWPSEAAAKLRVVVGTSGIDVLYPEALSEVIDDLEYGTPDSNPRPVFRKFASKHSSILVDQLTEVSLDRLFDKGVLP